MTLKDRITADLKQAMRQRDQNVLTTLRLLQTAIRYEEVEKGRPLDDDEVVAVAARQAKQRRESIDAFRAAGRQDLVEPEEAQLQVLLGYLPQQMSTAEIEQAAREAIEEVGATGPGDLGAVMRVLMPRLKGKADGAMVNQVVRNLLASR